MWEPCLAFRGLKLNNYLVWVEFPPRARGKKVKKSIKRLN
jgi:hypothetical protein